MQMVCVGVQVVCIMRAFRGIRRFRENGLSPSSWKYLTHSRQCSAWRRRWKSPSPLRALIHSPQQPMYAGRVDWHAPVAAVWTV